MNDEVSFDRYRFDPQTARLWADAREIRLTRKAAAVLGLLIERAGRPVTKEELFASIWRNRVVSDDALATCIQELRKALGDDARKPRYIETRHGSGYQFVAGLARAAVPAASAPGVAAVAVLPFTDMSPDRDQDYFCEGLAEELIDALTNVDGLRVAARSSSFQFRSPGLDIQQVGRQLGVDALLEGSVRKDGDRLRITVQLIEVASGYHKWSQRFERTPGDVFAIQDEIAETVATILRGGALCGREVRGVRRLHTAAEPYEYFLRGRQKLHRLQQPDLDHSRRLFEQAIALDAGYAPAWAGLATVHAALYEWFGAKDEDLDHADRASRIALERAPELADANVARGFVLSLLRRYDDAQLCFEAAAHINPHLFEAYYYHARACFARGEIERSVGLFRQAAEGRQEDFQSQMFLAQSLRRLGRLDEAHAARREGIARAERALALNPVDARALSLLSLLLYEGAQHERAFELSARSVELYPDDTCVLSNAACLRAKAGMKEEALAILERVFGRGLGKRDWVERDPDYDTLRNEPRFKLLLERLK